MNGEINTQGEGKGSMIGSIVVVVILIIGAIYLFSSRTTPATPTVPGETATTTLPADNTAVSQSDGSDEVSQLEADAATTDLAGIDTDAAAFNNELGQ